MRALLTRLVLAVVLTVSGWVAPVQAGTGAPFAAQTFQGISDPRSYTGLAAWYDVSDVSSLRNNAGAVPSTGEGIKLVSDKSGNSSVNVLCLNGVAGNYASAPSAAPLNITGTIEAQVLVRLPSWTPATTQTLCAKWDAAGNRSYTFQVNTTGSIGCIFTEDGTTQNVFTSSVVTGFAAFTKKYLSFVMVPDNGGGVSTGTFYTSDDGTNWTQLGVTINGTVRPAGIFVGTSVFCIGALNVGAGNNTTGNIESVKIYNGDSRGGGALALYANFAAQSKLAPSFTESSSNAATVTINTSGATGARISGARDLYQGTAANQPILTIAAAGNYLTFDGSNDYLKAAAFSLSQPETVYFVGSQVTWTINDNIFSGNATESSVILYQRSTTPTVTLFAGANGPDATTWATSTNAVITAVANNASSLLRVNRGTATTGTASTQGSNGFTLGAAFDGSYPGNITASEVLIYSNAATTAQQDATIGYLARKWSISGGFAHLPPPNVIPFEPSIAPWKREDELMAA